MEPHIPAGRLSCTIFRRLPGETFSTKDRPANRESENPTAGDQIWPSSAREHKGSKDQPIADPNPPFVLFVSFCKKTLTLPREIGLIAPGNCRSFGRCHTPPYEVS
jgi:hypothetical protein